MMNCFSVHAWAKGKVYSAIVGRWEGSEGGDRARNRVGNRNCGPREEGDSIYLTENSRCRQGGGSV